MYNLSHLEPKFKNFLISKNISAVSLRNYLSDIRHFFGWLVNRLDLQKNINKDNLAYIEIQTINQYKTEQFNYSLPPKTINRRLSTLRKFFEFCQKIGLIAENPAKAVANLSLTKQTGPNLFAKKAKKQMADLKDKKTSYEKLGNSNIHPSFSITNFDFLKTLIPILLALVLITHFTLASLNKLFNKEVNTFYPPISSAAGSRYIAFKARLTDDLGNPITTKTDVVFNLYNSSTDGKILYTASCIGQNYAITPDVQGNFKTLVGSDCGGKGIPSSIFAENQDLYIGITVGNDKELSPRQQIPNVGYAISAATLQGLTPGASTSAIPFIDSSGTLLISADSPVLKSTSGMFTLNAKTITITTPIGSSGNINLSPDLGGNTLITSGNLGVGTLLPSAELDIAGSASLSGNLSFRGATTEINQLSGGNIVFQTQGNIGIGTVFPTVKLDVAGQARFYDSTSGYAARIENNNPNNTSGQTGLQIKLGTNSTTNPTTNDRFISFLRGDSTILGRVIGNGSGGITYSTTGSDFAEYFLKDAMEDFAEGTVVSINSDLGISKKSSKEYDPKVIGVVSTHPGFAGGEPGQDKILVALVGQMPIKMSKNSPDVKAGDFLTSSNEEGLAMKAEKPGMTIGKALEEWHSQDPKETILAYINVSWYDPEYVYAGKLEESKIDELENIVNELSKKISNNQQLISENLSSLASNIVNVREKITSPVVETERLTTNEIKPKDENLIIELPTTNYKLQTNQKGPLARLIIKGLEGKTVASVDAAGNASFSGQLLTDSLSVNSDATIAGNLSASDASLSGKLVAKQVESENINSLTRELVNNQTNINDIQKLLADIKNQPLPNPQYYQTNEKALDQLTVTGPANLYNLTVAGSSTIGNLLIENNSILSLAWDLKLSALSSIKLFEDAVVIAKDGSIRTKGKLIAEGGIKTNKIEPIDQGNKVTIEQLAINNLTINDKYLEATSSSAIIAAADNFNQNGIFAPAIETKTATAGNGLIDQNSSEVIVYNSNIKESSLIYITPTSPTPVNSLSVVKKETCSTINYELPTTNSCKSYFKVALDKPAQNSVNFNWLIIN